MHVNSLNTLLQLQNTCVSKCKSEVNWQWRSVVPCCCGVQRMLPKKMTPISPQFRMNMRFFSLGRPSLSHSFIQDFFLSFFGGVVSICFAGRFAVDGQRSCSQRVSCWLEGLVSIRGVKYRPVRHPDGADSHSGRAEEFLPAVKGLFH